METPRRLFPGGTIPITAPIPLILLITIPTIPTTIIPIRTIMALIPTPFLISAAVLESGYSREAVSGDSTGAEDIDRMRGFLRDKPANPFLLNNLQGQVKNDLPFFCQGIPVFQYRGFFPSSCCAALWHHIQGPIFLDRCSAF